MFSACAMRNPPFLWVGFLSDVADKSVLMSVANQSRLKTSVLVTHVSTATDKGSDDISLHGQKMNTIALKWSAGRLKPEARVTVAHYHYVQQLQKNVSIHLTSLYAVFPTFFELHWLLSVIVRKTQQWASTDKHKYMCVCVSIFLTFINFGSCFQSSVMCSESTSSSEMTLISLLQPDLFHGGLWKSKKTCLIRLCSVAVLVLQFLFHS